MKNELKVILKEALDIEVWFSDLDIDGTLIYFIKNKFVGETIIELLQVLDIQIYCVPDSYDKIYDDEVCSIMVEVIN